MKLSQILNLNYTLKKVIDDENITSPLLKFKLLSITKAIEPPISNFEVIRNDLILKYGSKDSEGNYTISPDDTETINKFNEDIEKILNEDIDINISKIKVDEIFNAGIPADYLLSLYDIISE